MIQEKKKKKVGHTSLIKKKETMVYVRYQGKSILTLPCQLRQCHFYLWSQLKENN